MGCKLLMGGSLGENLNNRETTLTATLLEKGQEPLGALECQPFPQNKNP